MSLNSNAQRRNSVEPHPLPVGEGRGWVCTGGEAPVRLGGPAVASPVNPLCDGSRAHRVIWFCGSTAGRSTRACFTWNRRRIARGLSGAGRVPARDCSAPVHARDVGPSDRIRRGRFHVEQLSCVSRGTEPTPSVHYPAAVPTRQTQGSSEWPTSQLRRSHPRLLDASSRQLHSDEAPVFNHHSDETPGCGWVGETTT